MNEQDTSNLTPDSDEVIALDDDAGQKLDYLVCCCIRRLKGTDHITPIIYPEPKELEYCCSIVERKVLCRDKSEKGGLTWNKGPVWKEKTWKKIEECNNILSSGTSPKNLYALHVRCKGSEDWKFKYVGVSDPDKIVGRLRQHLVNANKNIASMLWNVAHAVAKGCEVGFSTVMVEQSAEKGISRASPDKALAGYVEDRVIEWLRAEQQRELWGKPWNKRKG